MAELSRKALLEWLKSLNISISSIEEIGKGDALCSLLTLLDSNFPKYKINPRNATDYSFNLKLVQAYLNGKNIKLYFPIDKMVNLKMQDNLEVLQWFHKYYEKEIMNRREETIAVKEESVTKNTESIARKDEPKNIREETIALNEESVTKNAESISRKDEHKNIREESTIRKEEPTNRRDQVKIEDLEKDNKNNFKDKLSKVNMSYEEEQANLHENQAINDNKKDYELVDDNTIDQYEEKAKDTKGKGDIVNIEKRQKDMN